MKFTVEKSSLFKSLSHVQSIVEKKNTLPILSNILIEAQNNSLVLSATDMDISITEKINCNVIEEGSTTVTAHTLYDIIRKLPESSEIEIISNDGKIMSLRAGKSKFSLSCLLKDDFPIIEIGDLENEISIESLKLFKLIDKTRFAVSNEETRYFLNGIYFHQIKNNNKNYLSLVATDGHRLAKFDCDYNESIKDMPGVIIPKKTVNELYKLLYGNFPDYKRVIPKENKNTLKVDRQSFSLAVDRVSTITTDKLPVIKFKIMKVAIVGWNPWGSLEYY